MQKTKTFCISTMQVTNAKKINKNQSHNVTLDHKTSQK